MNHALPIPVLDAESAARRMTGLRRLVDDLFKASDAAALASACATFVRTLSPQARVGWRTRAADEAASHDGMTRHDLVQDERASRTLEAWLPQSLTQPDVADLRWVGTLAHNRLRQQSELAHLYDAVSSLAQAERLQRALYAIADQASAHRDLRAMLHSLHDIIGSLMYAENFYTVLCDTQCQRVRFAYFADVADADTPDADTWLPLDDIRHSMTWYLIRNGRPIMGSMDRLAAQVDGPLTPAGPPSVDWLGVPLMCGQEVVGGLVVQSYSEDAHYTEQDRELLAYVAQHVQTALERRKAHADLESRVAERTTALRDANRVLQQQVLERQRGERLQAALFRIAELANATESLDAFYAAVHRVIGGLLYARNFYIAVADTQQQILRFPYSVDEVDPVRLPRAHGRGSTEYVLRTGKPLLAGPEDILRLVEQGEITHFGTRSVCWLGVPLTWDDQVMGVLAVQSYSPEHTYVPRDQELLTFVSYHVANALQRKRIAESLKHAYADMERRVTERTRALALANRDLREQIAERERAERRLKYETLHDSLTGLPNRALLLQRLEQAMQRYQADPAKIFAVLFLDLDRFKVINDSVGHLVGDDLLFQVGGRVRACLKTRDMVARLGGDEFAVLVEGIDGEEEAQQIAERIITELHTPFRIGVKELFTSVSIGITVASPHYRRAEELLRDADAAMYSAKGGGRHRAELFDDRLRRNALRLLEVESDLRRAITREEFVPYYQPIVRLEDRVCVGYEALMRWQHPERGVLLPGDFLGIAEDSGCSEEIDWQIFAQVFAQTEALASDSGFVSINLSARHFLAADIDERLFALLAEHNVRPACLRIEVTEGTLLTNPAQVKRILHSLRRRGIAIALDDFGTGYSSLSYMHQYPIEALKIDRSFITVMTDNSNDQSNAVVRAIQAMADSLHMQVIAEGIETAAQAQALQELGCRFGQGFLYSRPQPVDAWLATSATTTLV